MSKLRRELAGLAREHGLELGIRNGHYHFRDAAGRLVAVHGGSPGDRRGLANLRSNLRKYRSQVVADHRETRHDEQVNPNGRSRS